MSPGQLTGVIVVLADGDVRDALVVVAHPDDVDFWAGGTVASWTDAGTAVTYCVLSDGDSGGFDPQVPRSAIPGIRQAEQKAAAAVLGVSDVRFLGYPDGCIEPTYALRRDITRLIRQVQPARVLSWSPEWSWRRFHRNHPDHRAAGEAALSAVFPDARNPFAHPELLNEEGLEPWEVGEVWLMGGPSPNHFVDITHVFDRKIAALRAHESQTAHRDRLQEDRDTGPGGIYSRLADIGHGPVRFTEDVSTRMPTPEEAEFLRLTPPQPVFFLVRVAYDANDRPVETCEHVMSGDRWQLSYAWAAD